MSDEQTTEQTEPQASSSGLDLAEVPAVPAVAPPVEPEAAPEPLPQPKLGPGGVALGTGRRKAAVARVRLKAGDGKFLINKREVDEFFMEDQYRNDMWAPLEATGMKGKVDISVTVHGGGITGQSGAILLGVSRALKDFDPGVEQALRDRGYLTRDAREVERKKYGQPGARRRFQFSKR